jgi:putrescine transport system permease protein
VVFGYARRGINPTIFAAATLLMVAVTTAAVAYSVWVARRARQRAAETQRALQA